MKIKLIKNLIYIILTFILIIESVIIFIIKIDNDTMDCKTYIVHASGDVRLSNGQTYKYTNTIDNFELLYNRGYRYFEYDFVFSSDNNIISCHEYEYLEGIR